MADRDPKTGRWIPGNTAGSGSKGVLKGVKPKSRAKMQIELIERECRNLAAKTIAGKISEKIDLIMDITLQKALEGDINATREILKQVPVTPRTVVEAPAELQHMPPDQRIAAVTRLAAVGQLSLEEAKELIKITEIEVEMTYIKPLKLALSALKAGGSIEDTMQALASVISLSERPGALTHDRP